MLIPILFLGSVAAGSYAFLPSTWHKLRHKLRREKGVADPTLYLTFDDGPSPEYTPRLLDLLACYRVKASFFVVTEFAEKHPHLIRRMCQEGHLVGFCPPSQCVLDDAAADPQRLRQWHGSPA